MTVIIYGAGAIGGITGARLAFGGPDVLLVDKAQDHVAAMNGRGRELALLAVKPQDTPAALEVLAPRLAPDGAIVSLQNGLNEELIAAAVGAERTVGCLVNWAADWQAAGGLPAARAGGPV